MYHILIVDDEEKIRALIQKYAAFEGFQTSLAKTGMEAIALAAATSFDLIIMDVMMPELDGFSAVKEIRKTNMVPILMLSARGEEYDKIHGFELGIDDYVVKPFSGKELMMRIHAILARTTRQEQMPALLEIKDLLIDPAARLAYVHKQRLTLTPKEYDLLFYLAKHKGMALTRDQLMLAVWGYDTGSDDRTLDTHIKSLRKALGSCSSYIVTIRGVGYRFEETS